MSLLLKERLCSKEQNSFFKDMAFMENEKGRTALS